MPAEHPAGELCDDGNAVNGDVRDQRHADAVANRLASRCGIDYVATAMADSSEILHRDGRVELQAPEQLVGSPLYNADLAPVPVARRTWTTWDYAALWISMAHCIPTYTMAAGLIGAGMSWWQALGTILLGN